MKPVHVLVFDGLADWEIGLVTFELHTRNGIDLRTVGFGKENIKTGGGLTIVPDLELSQMDLDNVGLIILPGGDIWHHLANGELQEAVVQLHRKGVPVAAICGATLFLAKVGILKEGMRHTSNSVDYLSKNVTEYAEQALYVDEYAIGDRNVITASGVASIEFTYEILKMLRVYDEAGLAEFAEFWQCRKKR